MGKNKHDILKKMKIANVFHQFFPALLQFGHFSVHLHLVFSKFFENFLNNFFFVFSFSTHSTPLVAIHLFFVAWQVHVMNTGIIASYILLYCMYIGQVVCLLWSAPHNALKDGRISYSSYTKYKGIERKPLQEQWLACNNKFYNKKKL